MASAALIGGIAGNSYILIVYGIFSAYFFIIRTAETVISGINRKEGPPVPRKYSAAIFVITGIFAITGFAGTILSGAAGIIRIFVNGTTMTPELSALIILGFAVSLEALRDASVGNKRNLYISAVLLVSAGAAVILGGIWRILDPVCAAVYGTFYAVGISREVYALLVPSEQ